MLNCQETSRLFSQSQDRPLSFQERLSLRLHWLLCGACRRFAQQLRFLRQALAVLDTRTVTDDRVKLSDRARQRIGRALRGHDRDSAAG